MLFVFFCPGTPEGSTGSGSGLKASQKTGQWLTDWEKPGIDPATPGLQDIGLYPSPRRHNCYVAKLVLSSKYYYPIVIERTYYFFGVNLG